MTRRLCAVLLALAGSLPPPAAAQRPAGWLQAEGFYHHVTGDYGDWKGLALRAVAPSGRSTIWYGELVLQEAFRDRGAYAALGLRHGAGDWFAQLSLGGGTGQYVLPELRADATLGRAWLRRRNLVTMVGATFVKSKSVYEDVALAAGLAAYFPGVTVEAGGRLNWSSPDAVRSERAWTALTLGRERRRLVVVRGSGGYEGYQLTGAVQTEQRFRSTEASVSWREWLGGHAGVFLAGEWYDNPYYTRTGVTVGLFRHW